MQHSIRRATVDAVPLAVVRRRTPQRDLSSVVPAACGLVWKAIKELNVQAGRHVALYWRIVDGQCDVEIGAEVSSPFPGVGDVYASATPAGEVASVIHFGPYNTLGPAHNAVQQWCKTQRLELAGPSWEVYGHWQDEWNRDPSKIRTDIFYALKA
ncbi:MAG TPA: GyrI-like domain-containing protein [Candidatus Acidoferrales bacterium]|nr:GyrI-like domain-containing protein [Candidatus Acidoferrales bacterium]